MIYIFVGFFTFIFLLGLGTALVMLLGLCETLMKLDERRKRIRNARATR